MHHLPDKYTYTDKKRSYICLTTCRVQPPNVILYCIEARPGIYLPALRLLVSYFLVIKSNPTVTIPLAKLFRAGPRSLQDSHCLLMVLDMSSGDSDEIIEDKIWPYMNSGSDIPGSAESPLHQLLTIHMM